jgi:hypothetical protein
MPIRDPDKRREADRARKRRARAPVAVAALKPPLPAPPNRDELLRILGVCARAGHVPAIRLLLDEYRRDEAGRKPGAGLSAIDALAAKRAARAAGKNVDP